VERMTGIEPAYSAWEADVLPLNYIRSAPTAYYVPFARLQTASRRAPLDVVDRK
jgi:hypothetical protein